LLYLLNAGSKRRIATERRPTERRPQHPCSRADADMLPTEAGEKCGLVLQAAAKRGYLSVRDAFFD
jgi:hypothetical protein